MYSLHATHRVYRQRPLLSPGRFSHRSLAGRRPCRRLRVRDAHPVPRPADLPAGRDHPQPARERERPGRHGEELCAVWATPRGAGLGDRPGGAGALAPAAAPAGLGQSDRIEDTLRHVVFVGRRVEAEVLLLGFTHPGCDDRPLVAGVQRDPAERQFDLLGRTELDLAYEPLRVDVDIRLEKTIKKVLRQFWW